jgi:hypothetical protein
MNWKDLYTEATSEEREQILHLLKRRVQTCTEKSRVPRPSILTQIKWMIAYCRDKLINRRGRAHWLGKRSRLQRPERAFIFLTFLGAITLLEPYEYAVWATVTGGITALAVPFVSIRYILRAQSINMDEGDV